MRWLFALAACLPMALFAEGMRTLEPIGSRAEPDAAMASAFSVPRGEVEAFVRELFDAWNGVGLDALLAEDFPDRERLLGDLADLPASARLRIRSVGPVQTLESVWEDDALVSKVAVRVRAQVELEGADGLQRHETTQELLIRFVRRLAD